ncbi:MAG: VWA domain-containing protein [Deltaproteobacteria bacterium]|nr:VWA domain-containing protein [Deltaproteobacteria bacterium]
MNRIGKIQFYHRPLAVLLAFWLVGFFTSCTDADIEAIVPYQNNKLALEGDFCTTDPAEVIYTTRILFLIDCSDSMRWNDPNGLRADAILDIEQMYRPSESVTFGIIRFGTSVVVETPEFTKDAQEVAKALAPIKDPEDPKQYLGGTDYNRVLAEAINFIERDRILNHQELEAEYITVFITDGAPQAGDNDPQITVNRILEQVRTLSGMGVTFHTMMMSTEMMGVPPEFLTILQGMATAGGGEYKELAGPAAIATSLGDLLDLTLVLRIFDLKAFYVDNRSSVVAENNGVVSIFVDSDGDGLADFIEEEIGTSPYLTDSDGDFISDLVEVRIGYDPLAKEQHGLDPSAFEDDDLDDLNNYEEDLLGTRYDRFDTDSDGIPDGLEVRYDTNPLLVDDRGDYDGDFIPNADEIWGHLNPRVDDRALQEQLAYNYVIYKTGRNGGCNCYHFEVDNISLTSPLGSDDRELGLNQLKLMVVDSPENKPDLMGNQSLSLTEIIFQEPNFRLPNALTLFLETEDFE